MAVIQSTLSNTLLSGTSSDDTIQNGGYWYENGTNTWHYGGSNVTINTGAGNDYIYNEGDFAEITGGNGNDTINNEVLGESAGGSQVKISGGAGNDSIKNDGDDATLKGGAGNDYIENWAPSTFIYGNEGNDKIYSCGSNVTINAGAGNDSIWNGGYYDSNGWYSYSGSNVLFTYSSIDGNDVIYGFKADSTLSISGGSYSTTKIGDNIIVTVGDGKISLIGAASLSSVNIVGEEIKPETNSWKLSGTTATYGTDSKTLVTVSGVKSTSGLSVSGKVVTVKNSALNKEKVTISGDGYTLALANDVDKPTTKNAAWSLDGTTATYKSSYKTAGYSLASNSKSISYSKATTATTLATVSGAKSTNGLSISGKKITLKNSALNSKVSVSGNYEFNFASDYKKSTITGSKNADTITANGNNLFINGGASNDTLKILGSSTSVKGGDGADLFIFTAGKSNVITDYAEEDKISITSGTAQATTSGNNVIFTVGDGKITVTGGKDKKIKYFDENGEHTYSNSNSNVIIDGKVITLTEDYLEDRFNVADFGNNLQTINASAVQLDLEIIGNKLANKIIGSDQNDIIEGGKANDNLTGGEGSDIFIYNDGDGNDVINDYTEEDKIKIASGTISKVVTSKSDVIFTVGKGKITIKGGANKIINYDDANGIEHFYPVDFNEKGTAATLLSAYSKDEFNIADYGNYADTIVTIDASAVISPLKITANNKANRIIGTEDDDLIDGGVGKDTILGCDGNDTLLGGKSNDSLTGGKGADVFVYASGDGNDVITDYEEDDIIQITKGTATFSKSGNNVIFTVGSNKITVNGAADKIVTYIDANGKTNYYPAPTKDSVIVNGTKVKLLEGYQNTNFDVGNVTNGNKVLEINAQLVSRNLKIIGNAKANMIIGGSGSDTLIGGKLNDTLFGGTGDNVYVYNDGDGNDVILDYDTGDKISIGSGSISSDSVSGSNVVLGVGKGKITVNNGTDKVITAVDKSGNNRIIGNGSANTIKGGTGNDFLKGNAGNDKLYGNAGNDTLVGGKGNDNLWGNAGVDTFIYADGDGKDIIYGFDNTDMLEITGTFSASLNSAKTEIYFKVGKTASAITLKDFGKTTSFNVNGDSYKISGTKLVLKK